MPRISRKEQVRRDRISRALRLRHANEARRRERISRGLRRYWGEVRAVAATERISLPQARGVLSGELAVVFPGVAVAPGVIPFFEQILPEVFVPRVRIEYVPSPGEGEFAFNMRDVNNFARLDLPERFRGERVTLDVQYTVAGETLTRTLEFEGGDTEQEFWSNYYEAIREDYDSEVEIEGMTSTDVAIAVMGMRA